MPESTGIPTRAEILAHAEAHGDEDGDGQWHDRDGLRRYAGHTSDLAQATWESYAPWTPIARDMAEVAWPQVDKTSVADSKGWLKLDELKALDLPSGSLVVCRHQGHYGTYVVMSAGTLTSDVHWYFPLPPVPEKPRTVEDVFEDLRDEGYGEYVDELKALLAERA